MIYLTLTKLPKFEPSAVSDARSFLKASFEAENSFWFKSCTGENMEKLSAEQSCPKF